MDDPSKPKARSGFVGWAARHPKTTVLIGFVLLIVIAVWVVTVSAERRLAQRIEAIRARGEPITLEDLQKLRRPGPNSLPDVLAIASAAKAIKLGERELDLIYVGTSSMPPTGCRIPEQKVTAARWYLDQLKSQLPAMHEAMRRGKGTIDVQWSRQALVDHVDVYSAVRAVTAIQKTEALVAAEEGDARRVGELLVELRYMLDLLGDDAPLLAMFVESAIHRMYLDRIERTINRCGLSGADLSTLQAVILEAEFLPDLRKILLVERTFSIGAYCPPKIWRGGTRAAFQASPGSSSPAISIPVLGNLYADAVLENSGELIEAARPYDEKVFSRLRTWEARQAQLPWYYTLAKLTSTAESGALRQWIRTIGTKRAMLVALGAERFRLDHRRWPIAANELVPNYLEAIPLDPIDGKPIRYAIIPEGIKAWTICGGDDADEDNGGNIQRIEVREQRHRATDSGWVILNPDLRGRESESIPPSTQPTTRPIASPSRN